MSAVRFVLPFTALVLGAVLLVPAAEAQVEQREQAIAHQLRLSDRAEKMEALVWLQRLGRVPRSAELRTALIETLEQENALRRERWAAIRRDEAIEPIEDDVYGSVAQAVVSLRDPAATPALAGAVGTGLMVIRSLVEIGEPAAREILDVIDSPDASTYEFAGSLHALRMMVENAESRPLASDTRNRIRSAALQHLNGRHSGSGVVLRSAIDLAAVLNDPALDRIIRALASDPREVIARGVTDPELVERTQKHAADRLAGVPPLPRQ